MWATLKDIIMHNHTLINEDSTSNLWDYKGLFWGSLQNIVHKDLWIDSVAGVHSIVHWND